MNNNADGAYAPTSAAAWFDWVENSLLPVTMANTVRGKSFRVLASLGTSRHAPLLCRTITASRFPRASAAACRMDSVSSWGASGSCRCVEWTGSHRGGHPALAGVSNGLGLVVGGIRLLRVCRMGWVSSWGASGCRAGRGDTAWRVQCEAPPPPRRAAQTRLAPGSCSLPPDGSLTEAYGIGCYDENSVSLSSDFGNANVSAELGVSAAFSPVAVAGDIGAPEAFEWVISTNLTLEEAQAQVGRGAWMMKGTSM